MPEELVLYSTRDDFETYIREQTGKMAAVTCVMGRRDSKTAMRYQHPRTQPILDARNARKKTAVIEFKARCVSQQYNDGLYAIDFFGCPPGIRTPIC